MADHPVQLDFNLEVDHQIPHVLPHAKIYSIQVGYKLFRLSGLSLLSDAPSFFTKFFSEEDNADKVLFIDRNPNTFEVIYNHLQGYSISIQSDYEFTAVLLDCFYFGLKGLQTALMEEDIFATIGNQSFKVSKNLFVASGNYPNYFTVLYDNYFVDIGVIERKGMIRPPPQRPASLNNRSPKLFADLLEILRGNNLVIQLDEHRELLVRECKYYRFLELQQRIIKHKIINNPFSCVKQEIVLNIDDIQRQGITNELPADMQTLFPILYTRPFMKSEPKRGLIFQLNSDINVTSKDYSEVRLILNKTLQIVSLQITNRLCRKILQVFRDYTQDFLTEGLNTDRPTVTFVVTSANAHLVINGMEMKESWIRDIMECDVDNDMLSKEIHEESERKRRKGHQIKGDVIEFKLLRSLWRMMMRGDKARVHAVGLEGVTNEFSFNKEKLPLLWSQRLLQAHYD